MPKQLEPSARPEESRKTRIEVVDDLHDVVLAGEYCALLGPPHRGKTRVMELLHERLSEQHQASPKLNRLSVHIDVRNYREGQAWRLPEIIGEIFRVAAIPFTATLGRQAADPNNYHRALAPLTKRGAQPLAILISSIDELDNETANSLATALFWLYEEYPESRPAVVISGASRLAELTVGKTSPLTVAKEVFLDPCTREEALDELTSFANEAGLPTLPPSVAEEIWKMTDGHWDLMRLLVNRLKTQEDSENIDARSVQSILAAILKRLTNVPGQRFFSMELTQAEILLRDTEDLQPIMETLREIEKNRGWLQLSAQLRANSGSIEHPAGKLNPELCLAFRRIDGRVEYSNELFAKILPVYFTDLYIADCLVLSGFWDDAKPFYQSAGVKRGGFRGPHYALTDLIFWAISGLHPKKPPSFVFHETVNVAELILGLKHVSIHVGKRQSGKDRIRWSCKAGNVDHDNAAVHRQRLPVSFRHLDGRSRHSAPVAGAEGWFCTIVDPVTAPGHVLALNVTTWSYAASPPLLRAIELLAQLAFQKFVERQRLKEFEKKLKSSDPGESSKLPANQPKPRRDVGEVVKEVLSRFAEQGFGHVQIAFLDLQRSVVQAVAASGDLQPLVEWTIRDIGDSVLHPDDDILIECIKTGKRRDIPDCFDSKSRCNQFTIKKISPPLDRQIVLPLKSQRSIGWPGTRVFGTVQIGRIQVPLANADDRVLRMLVRYAATALDDVRLFEERQQLIVTHERQLQVISEASKTFSTFENIDAALQAILNSLVRVLNADRGGIALYDPRLKCLVYRAVSGKKWTPDVVLTRYESDDTSTIGWVYSHKSARLNRKTKQGSGYRAVVASVRSNCAVPIQIKGEVRGTLVLDSDKVGAFSKLDLQLLDAVSGLIGSLIEKGQVFVRERVHTLLAKLLQRDRIESKLDDLVGLAKDMLLADECSLFLDTEGNGIHYKLSATTATHLAGKIGEIGYENGQGRTGWVAKHNRKLRTSLQFTSAELAKMYGRDLKPRALHVEIPNQELHPNRSISYLAVPVASEGRCWGVIRCVVQYQQEPHQMFSSEDEEILETIAGELGDALERSHVGRIKDQLSGEIAHKLSGPVSLAMFHLREVEKQNSNSRTPAFKTALEELEFAQRQIERVMTRERIVNRQFKATKRRISLDRRIRKLIETVAGKAASLGIKLQYIAAKKPLMVCGQADQIHEILQNVVLNALGFAANSVKIHVAEKSGQVMIDVEDDGPGMSEESMQRCFEPHYSHRVNARIGSEGMGLGLPIARELARLNGGEIVVGKPKRKRHKGIVFTITLRGTSG